MEESILLTIKKLLGLPQEYDYFDTDIIVHINSAFSTLKQLGVGPSEGFYISDDTSVWSDFVSDGLFESVKTYIYLKVRLAFDPPSSSFAIDSIKNMISEYEWRLEVESNELNREEENTNG